MTDLFTTKVGDQVHFLEGAFVLFMKRFAMQWIAGQLAWLFAVPIIGPFANLLIGRKMGQLFSFIAGNGEVQAYFINTRRRTDLQAKRFEDLINVRNDSRTLEELNANEAEVLKDFGDLVKYST